MKYCVVSLVFVILLGVLAVSLGKPCDNPELVDKAFECYIFCIMDKYLLEDSVALKDDTKLFNDYYKQLVEYECVTGRDIKNYLRYYK